MIAMLAAASTLSMPVLAQQISADQKARQLNPCGGKAHVSAEYLADGRLKVVCPYGSISGAALGGATPGVLGGTGLAAGGAAAAIGAGLLLVVAVGSDNSTTTTTTTTN